MSTANSPSKRPPAFDGSKLFESNFSDYSQMKVPQRIVMDGFSDSYSTLTGLDNPLHTDDFSTMHVPERIVVVGGEKLASTREPFPEMRLENLLMGDFGQTNPIELPSPPSTLTLDEISQRMDPKHLAKVQRKVSVDLFDSKNFSELEDERSASFDNGQGNQTILSTLNTSIDEFSALRKQIRFLQRRMGRIETEIEKRNKREMFLYTIGLIYFTVKGLLFLKRIW